MRNILPFAVKQMVSRFILLLFWMLNSKLKHHLKWNEMKFNDIWKIGSWPYLFGHSFKIIWWIGSDGRLFGRFDCRRRSILYVCMSVRAIFHSFIYCFILFGWTVRKPYSIFSMGPLRICDYSISIQRLRGFLYFMLLRFFFFWLFVCQIDWDVCVKGAVLRTDSY